MITALEALASWMSLSVICPTPASSTRTFTSSCASFSTTTWIASALPCTSALIRTATSFCSPAWMRASIWSSVPRAPTAAPAALSRCRRSRNSVISRARPSFSTTTNGSPADGAPLRPRISTGVDGPASVIGLPLSSSIARTRPHSEPATTISPCSKRAALHQHGADRAAAAIEPAFDHRTFGRAVRVGLQVENFGLQQDRLLQLVEAGLLQRRNRHVLGFAAHFLDHDRRSSAVPGGPGSDWRPACPSC